MIMHPSAMKDAYRFAERYLAGRQGRCAELGSLDVNGSLRQVLQWAGWQHVGCDIVTGPGVDRFLGGEYEWPGFPDDDWDVVVSTQTMEHVRMPWRWVQSIVRILKPGGLVYLCAPNTAHFHEHPVDCWRVWPDGMRALLEYGGLEVLECYQTPYTLAGRDYGDTTGIGRKHG